MAIHIKDRLLRRKLLAMTKGYKNGRKEHH